MNKFTINWRRTESVDSVAPSFEKTQTGLLQKSRVESIDLLRGIVMVIMALDHVRHFLHFDSQISDPGDIQHTTPAFFFTRSITHLCAPTFILLAGTSAYFIAKRKTKSETSFFLGTRGLWLVFLQATIVRFGWNFDVGFHYNSSTIISTIGFCMIALSLLIHLNIKTILFIGLAMVFGHNALDGIAFENGSVLDFCWSFLHVKKSFVVSEGYWFVVLYPLIPWIGVMALGYCLGRLFDEDYSVETRKKIFLQLGMICLSIFIFLRWLNFYGDLNPWSYYDELNKTVMSFFNVEKYPPSLLYLCLTLGISLILLSNLEGKDLKRWKPITIFGKVALFYYVLHIYVIHLVTLVVVVILGYPAASIVSIDNQISPLLKGKFGFTLAGTYLFWIGIVLFLYPLCNYWNSFKARNKNKWWVSYV